MDFIDIFNPINKLDIDAINFIKKSLQSFQSMNSQEQRKQIMRKEWR